MSTRPSPTDHPIPTAPAARPANRVPARIDVLLHVSSDHLPPRLAARAHHTQRIDEVTPSLIAGLRSRIPNLVGLYSPVLGDPKLGPAATELRRHGLPVIVFSPAAMAVPEGIELCVLPDGVAPIQAANSLSDLIGRTPLLHLHHLGRTLPGRLLAKCEFLNPGGSVKDRPALEMIEAAERSGELRPGGTIVEPTSGNTGVALAMLAATRGYHCVFTVPDKVAPEKIDLLRAYGATVHVCPTAVEPSDPASYYSVARRVVETTPGAYSPNQYANPANPLAHEKTTGPELWLQTEGRITHLVAGLGTGGTLSGIGRYLKKMNPAIQIIGADPVGSIYSGGAGRPYLVEGIGEDFWPSTVDLSVIDRVVAISDAQSFALARRCAREEGLLVGGSSGTALAAALGLEDLTPESVVVVLIPDSGRGYLSKLYSDTWMADHGFSSSSTDSVAALLHGRSSSLPPLVHLRSTATVNDAIALFAEFGVSQIPVVTQESDLALAEVVGTISEEQALTALTSERANVAAPVTDVMGPPLPLIGIGQSARDLAALLADSPAALVIDAGHPVGVLTRSDLLVALSAKD